MTKNIIESTFYLNLPQSWASSQQNFAYIMCDVFRKWY